jgi:predicted phosphodiesterase
MDNTPRPDSPLPVAARLGVIGDIHTEIEILEWALEVLVQEKVEHVLSTGDIADGPQDAEGVMRTCQRLREHSALPVLGNHDRWLLDSTMRDFPNATFLEEIDDETRAFLRGLPPTREFQTPHGLLLLGHGLGRDDMAVLYPHDRGPELANNAALQALLRERHYRFVVGGHTHRRMVRSLDGITFINAGALGATREPCCVVLDFEQGAAQFHDYVRGQTTLGPRLPIV